MQQAEEKSESGLIEGKSYPFEIRKIIQIPGSGEKHFVLIGPDQKKYLLKASYYEHYALKIGRSITCFVDKINCSGQIFLEPQHPYYTPGERYDFLLIRISQETNIWGAKTYTAWVRDLHRFEWPCLIDQPEYLEPGISHLSCRVERIKKAQLFLSLPSIRGFQVKLRRNTVYDFKIKELREHDNSYYYILESPYGSYHLLPKRFYEHFNYTIGQSVQVRVVELNSDGSYQLEPLNPYYRIGETYLFKFLRFEKSAAGDFQGQKGVLWVQDHFGQAIKVQPKKWQTEAKDYQPDHLTCKVLKFKKGRLVLENLAEPENLQEDQDFDEC